MVFKAKNQHFHTLHVPSPDARPSPRRVPASLACLGPAQEGRRGAARLPARASTTPEPVEDEELPSSTGGQRGTPCESARRAMTYVPECAFSFQPRTESERAAVSFWLSAPQMHLMSVGRSCLQMFRTWWEPMQVLYIYVFKKKGVYRKLFGTISSLFPARKDIIDL